MRIGQLGWIVCAVSLGFASPASAASPQTREGRAVDGTRYYEDSLVIAAPASRLWRAFADSTELRRWAAPVSAVDFRLGGVLESAYDPKGHIGDEDNIRQSIVAYVPDRLIVFRNLHAPRGLPGRDAYPQTVKIVEFASQTDGTTLVTISGVGFGPGKDFDQLYAFFIGGDRAVLQALDAAYGSHK
ncbi:MAG TPA: SRPBCC domain-containing protein [Sphingomonas sp.]|nr:SRPBCC domain-containing protein [Sphingomonas sp.]